MTILIKLLGFIVGCFTLCSGIQEEITGITKEIVVKTETLETSGAETEEAETEEAELEETETEEAALEEPESEEPVAEVPVMQAKELPEVIYSVTGMDAVMHATKACKIYVEPSGDYDEMGSLTKEQAIRVTGETDNGWYQVEF